MVLLALAAGLSAADKDAGKLADGTAELLREATGVTDEDASRASARKSMSLFDAYALSVTATERLAIQGEAALQADAMKQQAFGAFLPYVSLRGTKVFPENKSTAAGFAPKSGLYLYARQSLLTGLNEWSNFKGSAAEKRLRRYQLHYQAGQLLYEVSYNFYRVIQLETGLKNQDQVLNLYRKTLAELRRRVGVGRSRQSEVLRTNAQVYRLEAQIKSMRSDLAGARLILSSLTGLPPGFGAVDYGSLPEPSYSFDEAKKALGKRWDILAARESVAMADARLLAAWGGHLPSLYLEGQYRLYQYNKTPGRDYYAAVGAELPLFSGFITAARIKEAESLKRQADLTLAGTRRLAEEEILDAWQSWESSKQEREAFNRALVSAEENYRVTMEEYRLNLVTILDVLVSLTTLQGAKDDYDRAELQYRLERIRLGVAVNEFSGKGIVLLRNLKPAGQMSNE